MLLEAGADVTSPRSGTLLIDRPLGHPEFVSSSSRRRGREALEQPTARPPRSTPSMAERHAATRWSTTSSPSSASPNRTWKPFDGGVQSLERFEESSSGDVGPSPAAAKLIGGLVERAYFNTYYFAQRAYVFARPKGIPPPPVAPIQSLPRTRRADQGAQASSRDRRRRARRWMWVGEATLRRAAIQRYEPTAPRERWGLDRDWERCRECRARTKSAPDKMLRRWQRGDSGLTAGAEVGGTRVFAVAALWSVRPGPPVEVSSLASPEAFDAVAWVAD